MSVVTKQFGINKFYLYCKGSPEMIMSLSLPNTIPKDIETVLNVYTEKGFRVIALGVKELKNQTYEELKNLNRTNFEYDLTFCGLIVMENRVKTETIPVIRKLKDADMKIIMITGDNIQTAISVAKDCEIITGDKPFMMLSIEPPSKTEDASVLLTPIELFTNIVNDGSSRIDIETTTQDFRVVMSGRTWSLLRQYFPNKIPQFVSNCVVYARMSSGQKQQVVQELQNLGKCVG